MTNAFVQAAAAKGHEVVRFDAAFLKLEGCHACESCFKKGKACVFDDDFNKIAAAVEDAEVVVFTMPVYWYTMPAQIKAVIDRLFSFVVGGKNIAGKQSALIACCEEQDISVFDGVTIPYAKTLAALKWENIGQVLIPGVLKAGEIEKTDGIAQAVKLTESI